MKSWKTTVAGLMALVALIATAVSTILNKGLEAVDWATLLPALSLGIGALFARDNNVTSEKAGAK